MDGRTAAAALGVGPQATRDEIRRAFRARAKVLHPDVGAAGSAERFITLHRALERLLPEAPEAPDASEVPSTPATPSRFDGFAASTPRSGLAIDLSDSVHRRQRSRRASGDRGPVTRDARGLSFEDHLAAALSRG